MPIYIQDFLIYKSLETMLGFRKNKVLSYVLLCPFVQGCLHMKTIIYLHTELPNLHTALSGLNHLDPIALRLCYPSCPLEKAVENDLKINLLKDDSEPRIVFCQ